MVDVDGRLDVVQATSAVIEVFPGLGDFTLGESTAFPPGGPLSDLVVGDLDLDGVVALGAVSYSNDWVNLFLNRIGEE